MTSLTINIDNELRQIFQAVTQRQAVSEEGIIKQALYRYLNQKQATENELAEDSIVGMFDLGDPLLSEKVEEILWR